MNNINVGDTFNLNLSSNQPIFTTWNARRRFLLTCGSEEPIAGDEIWSAWERRKLKRKSKERKRK